MLALTWLCAWSRLESGRDWMPLSPPQPPLKRLKRCTHTQAGSALLVATRWASSCCSFVIQWLGSRCISGVTLALLLLCICLLKRCEPLLYIAQLTQFQ